MKYRVIATLLILLLLLGICACNDSGTQIEANKSTFLVNFHVDCDEDIYGIHFEYYLDGTPVGGGVVGNADGSALKNGEVLTKEFILADFPEGGDLAKFQIEFFALDVQGQEYPCNGILSFAAVYGNVYDISIGGGYDTGFTAEKRNS